MTRAQDETDLAVIVLTYNEEANIAHALGSVASWAREVFVVDSFSTDRTVEIASSFPKVQVFQNPFQSYSSQWNWALENLPITAGWILKLDADEMVPCELREEIGQELAREDNPYAGYYLRFRLRFMGRQLRFGGFSYTWLLRLWQTHRGRFGSRPVNEHVILDGRAGRLRAYLVHHDRKGVGAWIWRHNRYSTMEAEAFFKREADLALAGPAARRRWLKRQIWPFVPFKPTVYFCYVYLLRLGFLDGAAGYHMCKLRSIYYYLIELKKKEARRFGFVPSEPDRRCASPADAQNRETRPPIASRQP